MKIEDIASEGPELTDEDLQMVAGGKAKKKYATCSEDQTNGPSTILEAAPVCKDADKDETEVPILD
jgi:hypothetical protein